KHITDEDKGKVIDNVKKSNPDKDITDAHVDDDGTFHGKVDGQDVVIPGTETVVEKQKESLNPPTDKVPVDDTKHITDEDKGKVIDNVKKSNPDKDITDAHVDDDGTFHGKVDGQDVVIPGTETVVEKQKESLNPPTDKVPVDDTKHITDEDKGKVIDNVKKSNPDKDITDAHVDDDGTFHGKVDGQDVVIPGTETVVEKQKESLNPPTDKVPVDDTKHITDEDKGKVIDNVKKSNPDKDITDAHVDDDGTFHGKVDGQDVVVPGTETVVEKQKESLNPPTDKVPVDDTKHITDEDKGKVIDNVKKSNP
ncbi:hypothetical protein L2Z96_07980, partial [Lactobacillus jensenii]|nr:hypothetical protein [Lactobacillus jensenii]